MSETELKYEVPEIAAPAIEASLRRLGARVATIESRYFDTADGRLAAAGLSLRLRKAGGRWEQTLKAPGRDAVDRLEETVARPGRWGTGAPLVDASLHHRTRAGEVLEATLRGQGSAPSAGLGHVSTSLVKRRAVEVESGTSRIEIAFDRGTIVAGEQSLPICELEYELKAGDPRALLDVARTGIDVHGLWLSTLSKGARGDAIARHGGVFEAVRAHAPRLSRKMDEPGLRIAIMGACLQQVTANASILADGQLDDEVVHQLRVGLRRLRTAARELNDAVAASVPTWEGAIADLFRELGRYRDRSLIASSMAAELAAAGSPAPELRSGSEETVDPITLVRGAPFQLALLEVIADLWPSPSALDASPDPEATTARDAHARVAARLGKLHGALGKAARQFRHADDDERHRVRKRLKRLRYLAELVGPLYPRRAVERYLDKLRPAQDELGAYVDTIVAIELARERVDAGDPRAWFNVGWLSARLPRGVKRCRDALEQAATARPFWS